MKNINVSNGEWNTLRFRRVDSVVQILLENNHTFTYQTILVNMADDEIETRIAGYLTSEADSAFEGKQFVFVTIFCCCTCFMFYNTLLQDV